MAFQLQQFFHFVSKITFRRAINAFLVFMSYHVSKLIRKPIHWGMPIALSIEPTTSCNLRCPECPSGLRSFTRSTGMLDEKLFTKIINELHHTLSYLTFYFQGEPYLHKKIINMIEYAHQKKIYTATSTNGHYLTSEMARKTVESGLDRLIISIDGTTQEVYESYRVGGSLEKVIEGTKEVVSWKKKLNARTPYIILQFLVVAPNEHQIEDLYALAKKLEVDDVLLKTAQIYNYEKGSDLIPHSEKYSRYKKNKDGSYTIKNKLINHCWKMWHSCVVTWDGKVVPCCFDKDASHVLGHAQQQHFQTIWKNTSYKNFRKTILRSRSEIDICKNCSEGTKVWT